MIYAVTQLGWCDNTCPDMSKEPIQGSGNNNNTSRGFGYQEFFRVEDNLTP